jgi:hypothetical protein
MVFRVPRKVCRKADNPLYKEENAGTVNCPSPATKWVTGVEQWITETENWSAKPVKNIF